MTGDSDLCYTGEKPQEWAQAVDALEHLHSTIFPKVLEKGVSGNWARVSPNYPILENVSPNELVDGYKAFEFVKNEYVSINKDNADRKEKNALEIVLSTEKFMKVMTARVKTHDLYDTIVMEVTEMIGEEYNNNVLFMKIKYSKAVGVEKDNLELKIMNRFEAFQNCKKKVLDSMKLFKEASKCVASEEEMLWNEKFNKNQYINYFRFEKYFEIQNKSIKDYFAEQETFWGDVLNSFVEKQPDKSENAAVETLNQSLKSLASSIHGKDKVDDEERVKREIKRVEQKLKMFQDLCKETKNNLSTANVEELQSNLKDLREQQKDLKAVMYNEEVELTEKTQTYILDQTVLMRTVSQKIETLMLEKAREAETRRNEIQANIRSMEAVKLAPLNGAEDFISWKKNQKFLNSHLDPYKKACALLATLKNPQDIEMCSTIYDFDKLLQILNDKYNHKEKIVPALKNKLEKLPKCTNDAMMLNNHRVTLNVYEQLKEVGAKDCFDGTVVFNLCLKFSDTVRKDFEKFKIRRRELEEIQTNHNLTFDDDGFSVTSGAKKDPLDIDLVDNSPEHRRLFLQFIREEAKLLEYTKGDGKSSNEQTKCGKCKKPTKYCKCTKGGAAKLHVNNIEANKACVCCGSKEPHLNQYDKPTLTLGRCPKFQQLTFEQRDEFANKNNACFVCLVPGHTKKDCRIKANCKKCKKGKHHPLLCRQEEVRVEVNYQEDSEGNRVYLKVSKVKILMRNKQTGKADPKRFKIINVMWDTGSMCNVITNNMAKKLGYDGKETSLQVFTLTNQLEGNAPKPTASKEFDIQLMDRDNVTHDIQAYGLAKVQNKRVAIKKDVIKKYASKFNVDHREIGNAFGPVDMIIGIGNDYLAPKLVNPEADVGMQLYETKFGKEKYLLAGVETGTVENGNRTKHVHCNTLEVKSSNYWTGDQLGLNTDPKCSTCIKAPACKQCKLMNQPLSFKEQVEAEVIKNSMKFDLNGHTISVAYPYNTDIDKIFAPEHSNKFVAEKMARNLKSSLKRDGLLETYTDNFLDMESRGAIKELSDEEMQKWESEGNPINYCSHHAVLKDSKSTACRSVCNSSLQHNNTSLNAMLPKGPTAISNLLHVLIRFRARPYTVIADLKKAYNSISTSTKDCHLRRLLWYRREDLDDPEAKLRTFGMLSMAFGDTPAQFYLECAKEEVANYVREVMKDKELGDAIISMSYVDDIALSVETIQEAEDFARKLPFGFGSYGFKIKEIFIGGKNVEQSSELETQLLFGHYYNPNEDQLMLKFAVNFSTKKRSQRTEPNLTSSSDLSSLSMTKRMVMSLLSSQYDPLGLASVFLAKYKIFLAKLFKIPEYDWNVPLKDEHNKKALGLVKQMIEATENGPKFERSNKPEGYKLTKLVVFVDASTIALQAVVYGVYKSENSDRIHTSLITGKNKITTNTVPRNELQSMVAGHRLALNVLEALDETVEEVCFLSDSTCTLDTLQEGYVSKEIFVINRVSEIRKAAQKMNCSVKYYHVDSSQNIADKGTREDCDLAFLSSSEWQQGPDFIKDLDQTASYKLSIKRNPIPYQVNYMMISHEPAEKGIWESLLDRTNNLKTALRAFCLVKSVIQKKSFKGNCLQTKADMEGAFLFFTQLTQEGYNMQSARTKQLVTFPENGVIYTKLRFPEHVMSNVFGKEQLPVIPGKSKLAKLLLSHAHQEGIGPTFNKVHQSIHQTLVNSRVGLYGSYITNAKQVAKGLVRSCPVCRRQAKSPSNAQMAERKGGFGEISGDGSAFNKIAVDYFGPFWCKPPKYKETRGTKFYKIYGMAVLCQQTRAVKFYPVEGYDTKSFLTTFEIHCSVHGCPSYVLSDPMSTFISGAKIVGPDVNNPKPDEPEDPKQSEFETTLQRKYEINWDFIPPGSQWRDPAERSIKSLKTMMQTIFNTEHNKSVLTINEYWSIFSQCSEILNRRPIQGFIHDDTLKFICPNQLLLGRTSKEAPASGDDDLQIRPRLELLHNIKTEFWKQLMNVLAADSRLMKYTCWYSQTRKPEVGDVVLVLYKTKVTDNYRIGVIRSVDENKRDLTCAVSPCQDGSLTKFKTSATMRIPVQRTILLYSPTDE